MMKKKITTLVIAAILISSLGACLSDDDVKDVVEYDLHIVNNTASAFDIYIDNDLENSGAYTAGHLAANQFAIIHELDIGVNYTVHLVNPGEGFDSPVHEKVIRSSGADVTWTIN